MTTHLDRGGVFLAVFADFAAGFPAAARGDPAVLAADDFARVEDFLGLAGLREVSSGAPADAAASCIVAAVAAAIVLNCSCNRPHHACVAPAASTDGAFSCALSDDPL